MLKAPMEIFEIEDGQSISFHVVNWELDKTVIHPPHAPAGKVVDTIRVHLPESEKPLFPHYYDMPAVSLVAQLLPFLERPNFRDRTYTITAFGVAPKKRFRLEVV